MEPNDGAGARAHELRASLGARRQVEALLAEASVARQAAAADADAILEEAQVLSDELLQESRVEADRITTQAHQRAEEVVARARADADAVRARAEAEAEAHRHRVRTEVTEQVRRELQEAHRLELVRQHEQQQATVADLEATVRILGVSLESASLNVGEMVAALGELHAHTAESLSQLAPAPAAPAVPTAKERAAERAARAEAAWEQAAREQTSTDERTRAQAASDELFRVTAPGTSVPSHRPVFDVDEEQGEQAAEPAAEGPRSATEAFLLSSHIDHGDPPLPPLDDTEIGARYARDAMRSTARSRTRQDGDPLEAPADAEPDDPAARRVDPADAPAAAAAAAKDRDRDAAGKPLGWLFRS